MSHTLWLFCRVLENGPQLNRVFQVKIESTESVADLMQAIKEANAPKLDHILSQNLSLWKVSIPDDEGFDQNIRNLNLTSQTPLSATITLSNVFADPPKEEHLHIVMQLSSTGECWFSFHPYLTHLTVHWCSFSVVFNRLPAFSPDVDASTVASGDEQGRKGIVSINLSPTATHPVF